MSGFNPYLLPTGYDHAGDGNTIYGTPSQPGQITTYGANGQTTLQVEELINSPIIERADQQTITHHYKMAYTDAQTWILLFYRGVILHDSQGNISKVLSAQSQRDKADTCIFTVVSEMMFSDLPPDEFSIDEVSLNIDIIKHPRYFFALNPDSTDASNAITVGTTTVYATSVKQAIIRAIQSYRDAPFYPSKDNINGLIQNNIFNQLNNGHVNINYPNPSYTTSKDADAPVFWDGNWSDMPTDNCPYFILSAPSTSGGLPLACAAAFEIISKIWRGVDTPYIAGYQINYSSFYWIQPNLNPGGYIENPFSGAGGGSGNIDPVTGNTIPVAVPELPDTFWSTAFPAGSAPGTIFDSLSILNPTSYSSTGASGGAFAISWLRLADIPQFNRTYFKLTKRWIGSPIGHWDYDIYGQKNRPTNVSDYNSNF